jgi:hypothetical protein
MYDQIIPWVVLGLLFILCLPIPIVRRLILAVTSWALRLALLAAIGGAAYLWFRPSDVPGWVLDAAAVFPRLRDALPDPTTSNFGIAVAAIVVGVMLPILAILDTFRHAAWVERDRARAAEPAAAASPAATAEPAPAPAQRPPGRTAAADAISSAGSRPARPR